MRRAVCAALAVAALAECKSGTRSTDTRSSQLTDPKLKVKFLDEYAMGPTTPLQAEFHVVYHDNSGGLVPGSDDYEITAAIRVPPDAVPKWADGCERARLDARPQWAKDLVGDKKEWLATAAPDTFRCGHEERIIHVKDGIIFRRLSSQ